MRTIAVVLAAGSGTRFGADKAIHAVRGKPLWRWSFETLLAHPDVESVGIVGSAANLDSLKNDRAVFVVEGGGTRQESSAIAVREAAARGFEVILIHDAARPFISLDQIDRVLAGVIANGAAAPALAVSDTLRLRETGHAVFDRNWVRAMQTPQGAYVSLLQAAYENLNGAVTDEMGALESAKIPFVLVPGEERAFKVTTAGDLVRVHGVLGPPETRLGLGYDIHSFSEDPHRPLWLGGLLWEGHVGLEGHSDADVLIHAVVDAILGGYAGGDIGRLYPNDDPRQKNRPSIEFLLEVRNQAHDLGWELVNIDVSVLAETPKIMRRAREMRAKLAEALSLEIDRVSVKATTNEKLGAIGRGEGIAAFATATLRQRD